MFAGTVTRRSNIKSHGVFVGQNNDGKEVVLNTTDLYYIADQLDVLENTIKALSIQQNAEIEYTYHSHTGSASAGTGCYTKPVYHQHTSSCVTQESHSGSCITVVYKSDAGYSDGTNQFYNWTIICTKCGGGAFTYLGTNPAHMGSVNSCGLDGVRTGWTLGCGKTPQSIDEAHIVFK